MGNEALWGIGRASCEVQLRVAQIVQRQPRHAEGSIEQSTPNDSLLRRHVDAAFDTIGINHEQCTARSPYWGCRNGESIVKVGAKKIEVNIAANCNSAVIIKAKFMPSLLSSQSSKP
jgi:hypothetical protein